MFKNQVQGITERSPSSSSEAAGITIKSELAQARELLWRLLYARFISRLSDYESMPDDLKENPSLVGDYVHSIMKPAYVVYLMRCQERQGNVHYLKVGHAKNLKTRWGQIQTCCPLNIYHVMYTVVYSKEQAICLEKSFQGETVGHVRGEWFGFKGPEGVFGGIENAMDKVESSMEYPLRWFRSRFGFQESDLNDEPRRFVANCFTTAFRELRKEGHDMDFFIFTR